MRAPDGRGEIAFGIDSFGNKAAREPLPGAEGEAAFHRDSRALQAREASQFLAFRVDNEEAARRLRGGVASERPLHDGERNRARIVNQRNHGARGGNDEGNALRLHGLREAVRGNPAHNHAALRKRNAKRLCERQDDP